MHTYARLIAFLSVFLTACLLPQDDAPAGNAGALRVGTTPMGEGGGGGGDPVALCGCRRAESRAWSLDWAPPFNVIGTLLRFNSTTYAPAETLIGGRIEPSKNVLEVDFDGVETGDAFTLSLSGVPWSAPSDRGVYCALRVQVTEGDGTERPVDVGGAIVFDLVDQGAIVFTTGMHTAKASGHARFRVLGLADHSGYNCGIGGAISFVVTHN